jgi:thioredoxin-like negative regulator of GroEL
MHSSNLAPLLGSYISDSDLKSILPQSRLAVIGIARALAKLSAFTTSQEVMVDLDLAGIEHEAKSFYDWNLLVWVAQQKGNDELYIRALQQVADLAPMDKAVRVRLAKAHEAAGRIDEALRQLEQASRRTNLDVDEQTYLRELKLRSAPPNGSVDFND